MSNKKSKIEGVAKAVKYELDIYTNEIRQAIKECAERVAIEGKTKLQLETQPPSSESGNSINSNRRNWKKYAKNWAVTNGSGENYARFVIYQNGKTYRLTHLLEYGHETRNGTRTRAFKHIEPISEYVAKQFEEEVIKIIERGGK